MVFIVVDYKRFAGDNRHFVRRDPLDAGRSWG